MYIFHLGFNNSGSTSLSIALNRLGIPTSHNVGNSSVIDTSTEDNKTIEVKGLTIDQYNYLDNCFMQNTQPNLVDFGFSAFTDLPFLRKGLKSCSFLYNFFPDSKFIFLTRDKTSWINIKQNHHKNNTDPKKTDPDILSTIYDKKINQISNFFANKPGQLLIMNITEGDGYDVLCPFLNLPVLNEPFPKTNMDIINNE